MDSGRFRVGKKIGRLQVWTDRRVGRNSYLDFFAAELTKFRRIFKKRRLSKMMEIKMLLIITVLLVSFSKKKIFSERIG